MLIALVSLDQFWENKNLNLTYCEKYFQTAQSLHADLIVFPEMTLTGFSNNISQIAELEEKSATVEAFKRLSRQYQMGTIFGVVFKNRIKAANCALFLDKSGEVLGKYQKTHPFSHANEDKIFEPGNNVLSVDFNSLNIGVTICYDLRFPEIYSALGVNSDLIVNIGNWPYQRIEHWIALLKARAIENQIYIAGINRIGTDHNGLYYPRSSIVFDYNGEMVNKTYEEGALDLYDINKEKTLEFRRSFSTAQDRRPELYKNLL